MSGRWIMMCAGEYHPMKIDRNPGDFVVAVDGGIEYLLRCGIRPDFFLGDFDSLKPELWSLVEEYRQRGEGAFMQLPVEKDDTDTVAAAKLGFSRGYREFVIYGGLGGRLDHTMANIQTLVWIMRRGGQGWLLDRETSITVIGPGRFLIPASFKGTVSLFALDRMLTGVTICGMKYEVENADVTNDFPIGCSNETLEESGSQPFISIGSGTGLLIMTEKLINRAHKGG